MNVEFSAADILARFPSKTTKHMWHEERAECINVMLCDLLKLAEKDGCIAAGWAFDFLMSFACSQDKNFAERLAEA